jgi:kynurenine formamidase
MSLEIYNLSHPFHQFMPEWPSTPSVNVSVNKFHAKDGLYEVRWEGIMHRCTHMDAPIHVTENTPSINDYPLWRLCGTGVAVSIPKGKWGIITPEDLENARPKIEEGDIVMINTGFHHKWADTDEYFAYGCGIYREGPSGLLIKRSSSWVMVTRLTTIQSPQSLWITALAQHSPTLLKNGKRNMAGIQGRFP